MITLPRVASRLFGEPLAIDRAKLDVIVTAVGPRLQGLRFDDDEDDTPPAPKGPTIEDGIACIEISGTLVAKCGGMAAMSGMTSYADIGAEFTGAIGNPAVRGIALLIDSPGGEVAGMFDLAAMMSAARGQKPVCAVVNCAASAAYLLASTADQIVVSQTGIVGSIGIIALHLDESRADEQAGLKYTAIYAGDRKNDGNPHEPLSPEAKSSMQSRVDTIYGMFTAVVAKNRGIADSVVRGTQAAIYMGTAGVEANLADRVGSPEDAMRALSAAVRSGARTLTALSFASSAASAANLPVQQEQRMETPTPAAETKVPTPAEVEAMATSARNQGFAEAAEIVELCAIAGMPGSAAGFITARKPIKDVRAELLAAKVAADKELELEPGVMPGQSAKAGKEPPQGKAKPWREVFSALGAKLKEVAK